MSIILTGEKKPLDFKLSVSKTKTYLDCAKKFHFSYILKLPQKEKDYFVFGKYCHKILEDFHLHYLKYNEMKDPYNKIMQICYKNATQEYLEKLTPEMKKEAFEICTAYLKIISLDKKHLLSQKVLTCEQEFKLNLDDRVILNGFIDRVQEDADGVLHVADYKTSKSKTSLKKDSFQLLTYAYVLMCENPSISKVRGSYILLRHNFECITMEFERDEVMKVKDKYLAYTDKITNEKDYEANPTFLCNYCDFLDKCEDGRLKVSPQTHFGQIDW